MRQSYLACALLALASCHAPYEQPKSICDLPRSLPGWAGTTVRWKGVAVGSYYHGFSLVAEDCLRRGIKLDGWSKAVNGSAVEQALQSDQRRKGLLRIDVSGKIIGEGERQRLWVTEVHQTQLQEMSDEEYYSYWQSKGF